MRKYLYIYKTSMIESLQYITSLILSFISFFLIIFIFINLWDYMYSDGTSLIAGYTKNQMMWYVLFTEFIWFTTKNRTLISGISSDVRTGTIAYTINKPYNYYNYILAKHFGEITINIILYLIISIPLGFILIGPIPNFNLINIGYIILVFMIAIIINSIIRITISLISFWIEDTAPIHWIYDKIILVLGVIFPIEMFPKIMQTFIKYSPVFVAIYGPVKLTIDFSMKKFYEILLFQSIYIVIVVTILLVVYKKGMKKLNVNGG